jgi:hypothetical protein
MGKGAVRERRQSRMNARQQGGLKLALNEEGVEGRSHEDREEV